MTWKFDASVAKNFVGHARGHIPNYDTVIDKSVAVCQKSLTLDSAIIDVGCATGETLNRLSQVGFTNLTGVDSSQDMLDQCQVSANLICSQQFPQQRFDAVLCNWTLHFMSSKKDYLQQIYNNLAPGGFLIVSDKTSLDPEMIDFYHDFKSSSGISAEEIRAKADSVRNIMHIDQPQWYLETLNSLGFSNTQIIDASWCFTTFFSRKTQG
jgi:trans-aconitate methyltransferase